MNIYIVYSLDLISNTRNTDFTAQNCLFGAVKLTKNTDTSNFKYVGLEFVLMKVVNLVLVILLMETT